MALTEATNSGFKSPANGGITILAEPTALIALKLTTIQCANKHHQTLKLVTSLINQVAGQATRNDTKKYLSDQRERGSSLVS
jgi:hypothetical protein